MARRRTQKHDEPRPILDQLQARADEQAKRHWALIRLAQFPLSRAQSRLLRNLLEKVHAMSRRFPWQVTNRELAEHLEVGDTTFRSAKRNGKRLGVLLVQEDIGPGGQRADRYCVSFEALERFQSGPGPPIERPVEMRQAGVGIRGAPVAMRHAYKERSIPSSSLSAKEPPSMVPGCAAESVGEVWKKAEVSLGEAGMEAAVSCCRMAQKKGYSVAQVLELLDHWKSKPGAWKVGAIWSRIENSPADRPVAEGWPAVDEAWEREQARTKQAAYAEKRRGAGDSSALAEERREAAELAELAALEVRQGERLDGMAAEAVQAIAEKILSEFLLTEFAKRGKEDPVFRLMLLKYLDANQ